MKKILKSNHYFLIGLFIVLQAVGNIAFGAVKIASVSGDWSNPITWGGVAAPTSTDDITINAGIIVVMDVNGTCGVITDMPGGSISGSGTLTIAGLAGVAISDISGSALISCPLVLPADASIAVSGTLTIAGEISGVATNFTKNGTGKLILTSSNTYTGSTVIAGGIVNIRNNSALGDAAGRDVTVLPGGRLELEGSLLTITKTLSLSGQGDGTAEGALYNVTGNNFWEGPISIDDSVTSINSVGGGLVIAGTIDLKGNQLIIQVGGSSLAFINGTISSSSGTGSLTKEGPGELSFGSQPVFLNTLTINDGTLTSTTGNINLTGNYANNGIFNHAGGTIVLEGSSVQSIGGTQVSTFNNLTLANASGAILGNSEIIEGTLTLINGNLVLGSNNLTLGLAAVAGTPSVSNMIVADGAGECRRIFTSSDTYEFPVGDETGTAEYSPITLNFTTGTFSSAYATVRVTDDKHPDNTSPVDFLTRYWTVTQTGISSYACDVTASFPTADVNGNISKMTTGLWNGTDPWLNVGLVTATTISAAGVTSFGDFTGISDLTSFLPTIILGENPAICSGSVAAILPYTGTTNSPDQYAINWDASALTAGFSDVPSISLPVSPIAISVPSSAPADIYTGTILVYNSSTGSSSIGITFTVTINSLPTANITGQTNVSCFGSNTGAIDLTTSGGTPDYTYSWTKGGSMFASTSEDLSGLGTGTYIVTVQDINSCESETMINITQPDELNLNLTQTAASCPGISNGLISATVNGTPLNDLEINLDGGTFSTVSTSPVVFNGLFAGNHTIILHRISDNGCSVTQSEIVTEPDALGLVLTPTNATCFGGNKSISAALSGTPLSDLEINLDGGAFSIVAASPVVFNGISAGNHTIIIHRISDNGCSVTQSEIVTEPDALGLVLTPTNATCFGGNKSISAALSGTPLSDLEINLDGGAFSTVAVSPVIFSGLSAGNHTIIIHRISDNGCSVTQSEIVTEPDALSLVLTSTNATCFGGNKSISATVSGTPFSDLEINIDGGAFSIVAANPVVFNGLSAGNHTIIIHRVSDNDCSVTQSEIVTEPDALGLVLTPSHATCFGGNKSISAAVNGTPLSDLQINIDGGTFAEVTSSPVVFNGLTAGNHTIELHRISDNTCSVTKSASVTEPAVLTPGTIGIAQTICYNTVPSALIELASATGGIGSYTYHWQSSVTGVSSWTDIPGATSVTYAPGNLTESTYYRRMVSLENCELDSSAFILITVNPIPDVLNATNRQFCNAENVSAISLSGSVTGTVFNWVNGNTTIGLSASGTGNIPGFNAVNTGNTPVTAKIIITPKYTFGGITCDGTDTSFVITVNPTPSVITPYGLTFCSGISSAPYSFTGSSPTNVLYDIQGGSSIGLNNQTAVSMIPSFNTLAGLATLVIIPKANGCQGSVDSIYVTVRPSPIAALTGGTTVCEKSTPPNLTFTNLESLPVLITYKINGVGSYTVNLLGNTSVNIPVPTVVPGVYNYQISSVEYLTSPNCANVPSINTATITVLQFPTASISGGTIVCKDGSQPAVIFTNPQSLPITVTYNINGSDQTTVNVPALTTASVFAPTGTIGDFVYNFVSVTYQGVANCPNPVIGSTTIHVLNTPTASISGGTTVCQNSVPRPNIVFTNPQATSITVFYTINSGSQINQTIPASQSVSIPVNTTVAGSFTYKLEGVQYTGVSSCLIALNSAVSIVVLATPSVGISGTTSICQNGTAPNIMFTNPQSLPITVTYNINGLNQTTINVSASSTATVSAPTSITGRYSYRLQSVIYQGAVGCSTSVSDSAIVTVESAPSISISSNFDVCLYASPSPNVLFTNSQSLDIDATYSVNGGSPSIVTIRAGGTYSIPVDANTNGTYVYSVSSVKYTSINGCINNSNLTTTVHVLDPPTVTISGSTTVCQATTSPTLTITNPQPSPIIVTYNINGANQNTLNIAASGTGTIAASTSTSGIFSYNIVQVTYNNSTGCTNTFVNSSAVVTVRPIPATPVAAHNVPPCAGGSLSLSASSISGSTYNWTGPNGFTSTLQNPVVSTNSSTALNGTYSVTAFLNGCSSLPGTTSITILPIPAAPTVANNGPVCMGSTLSLTASSIGGATYSWSGPNSFLSTSQNPTVSTSTTTAMSGNYSVYATLNGCPSATVTTVAMVNQTPVITNLMDSICNGSTFIVSPVNGTPMGTVVPAGTTYSWTAPTGTGFTGGPVQNNQSSISQTLTLTNANVGATATYTVTPKLNTCNGNAFTVTVSVSPTPRAIDISYDQFNRSTKTYSNCTGLSGQIVQNDLDIWILDNGTWKTLSSGNFPGVFSGYDNHGWEYSYESPTGPWIPSTGTVDPNDPAFQMKMDQPEFTRLGTHYFRFFITDNGCTTYSGIVSQTMTSALSVVAGDDINIVCSSSPTAITLSGASVTGQPGACGTWTIDFLVPDNGSNKGTLSSGACNANPEAVTYTPPANYAGTVSLILTSNDPDGSGGCSSAFESRTITITPAASASAGNPQSVCAGSSIQLNGSVSGSATGGTWSVSPVGTGTFSNVNSLTSTYNSPAGYSGTVTLTLTPNVSGGCAVSSSVVITINPSPQTTGVSICAGGSGSLTALSSCPSYPVTSTGTYFPNAAANNPSVGTTAWNNTNNVFSPNGNNYTTVALTPGATSQYLYASNFGFNISDNAVILGVEVTINRSSSNSGGNNNSRIQDNIVKMVQGGSVVGSNLAAGANWPISPTSLPYGGASNLWGLSWTPAQINATNFGVALSVTNANASRDRTASVDYINVKVYYHINGEINWYSSTNAVTPIATVTSLNPVGVLNSGLLNTDIPGTYKYYAECSTYGGCRTETDYIISAAPTVSYPNDTSSDACNYTSQNQVNTAFSNWLSQFRVTGGSSPIASFTGGIPVAPTLCSGGVVIANYFYSDLCASGTITKTFTLAAPPAVVIGSPSTVTHASCEYANQTALNTAFYNWLSGFTTSGGCAPVSTFVGGTPSAPAICGGSVIVNYSVSDLCVTQTRTATFTVSAAFGATLSKPADVTRASCNFTDQTALDADFTTWLTGFSFSGGCSGSASYGSPSAPLICVGGTITVTYQYHSACETKTVTAQYTLTAPSALVTTKPSNFVHNSCEYTTQAQVDAAFSSWLTGFSVSGGCSPSHSYGSPSAPVLCTGGTTTVTYIYSDKCASGSLSATFTINKPSSLSVEKPAAFSAASCTFATQAELKSAFDNWLTFFAVNGGCSPTGAFQGTPTAPSICGGTTTAVYNYSDLCESGSISVTYTITTPSALSVSKPADYTAPVCYFTSQTAVNTAFAIWLNGFGVSGGCNPAGSLNGGVPVAPGMCGGSVSVTYNVADRCSTGSATATYTLPSAALLTVSGAPSELQPSCKTQVYIDSTFTIWKNKFSYLGGCGTSGMNLSSVSAPSACGGTIVVNYSSTDLCGQAADASSTFAIDIPNDISQEPTFTVPGAKTIYKGNGCTYDASPAITGVPTNVDGKCAAAGSLTINYSDSVVNGSCYGSTLIYRKWKVTDNCGNKAYKKQLITIMDNIPPVISCPTSVSGYADNAECFASGIVLGTATATDNCSTPVITNNAPANFPVGTTTVVWTATDACGNYSTCNQTVTIIDNNDPPTITCPSDVIQTAGTGNCYLNSVVISDPVTTDNCGVVKQIWTMSGATTGNSSLTGINSVSNQTFNVGTTTVTYTVFDASGHTAGCSFNVWIKDLVKPVFSSGCPANVSVNADAGQCSANVTVPVPTVSDPCNEGYTVVNNYNHTNNASDTYPVGTTAVVWAITDASGNITTCSQNITVSDTQVPVFITCPANMQDFITNGGCSKVNVSVTNPTFTDNCGISKLTWSMSGATTGNSAPTGINYITGSTFYVGVTSVHYTLTDSHGLTATCSFDVWIKNLLAPQFSVSCPADVAGIAATGLCTRAVTVPTPTIANPCSEAYTVVNNSPYRTSLTNASGNYPVGTTNVTWTITDASGNIFPCSQKVVITDDQPPVFTSCPSDMQDVITNAGCSLAGVTVTNPTYTDNCSIAKLTWTMSGATIGSSASTGINYVTGQTFNVGITTVEYTVTDASGLTATCTFEVWIKNLTAPQFSASCPSDITVTVAPEQCASAVTVPSPTFNNPCSEAYTVINNSPYRTNLTNASGTYPIGITTVTWTVTDASGNITSCTQHVTVNDLPPTISCPGDIYKIADYEKTYASNVVLTAPLYADNCPGLKLTWIMTGASTGNSGAAGINLVPSPNTFNEGVTTITYTVTDANSNSVSCSYKVTVEAKPDISCLAPISRTTDAGVCTATLDPGMPVKNVGAEPITWTWTMTGATVAFGTGATGAYAFNKGVTTIKWVATNVSGADSCNQTITISDTIRPNFALPAPLVQCVESLKTAVYNDVSDDINPNRPEYFLFSPGNTLLNLDPALFTDNCLLTACTVEIRWRIDMSDGSHIPASGYNTGQPSTIGSSFQFLGDGATFTDVVHHITYWIVDCAGNVSSPQTQIITIKPRPNIIKLN